LEETARMLKYLGELKHVYLTAMGEKLLSVVEKEYAFDKMAPNSK
jgi:hypothetical protein